MSSSAPDPVELTRDLVRCASVTPLDEGAQDILIDTLKNMGFRNWDVTRENIRNTFFRIGDSGPHFCFAGHTDVVPAGDESLWRHPPFSGAIENGILYGRGTADMKGNVAAFVAATGRFLEKNGRPAGSISLLITGDEEDEAINGTVKVLEWMKEHGHIPDMTLVGEPSNLNKVGEAVRIGRRGSLTCYLKLTGKQGHVAYPEKAENPIPRMARILSHISDLKLDDGNDYFAPSSLQISTVDVGNPADNVIPAQINAEFNVRFNDHWNSDTLKEYLISEMRPHLKEGDTIDWRLSGESFITQPGEYTDMVCEAIEDMTGLKPEMNTGGGTSDARFVQAYSPVVEFGLVNKTIHQTDEHVPVKDLETLTRIYERILEKFFNDER